jgi:hypothetical protein
MFHITCSLISVAALALSACSRQSVVTYYDRNHDGVVDFELHDDPGYAHARWDLIDTHFDGRYDTLEVFASGGKRFPIEVPVQHNGIHISKELPKDLGIGQ